MASTDLSRDTVTLTSRGVTLELRPIGTNAICALEDQTGLTFGEIMQAIGVTGVDRWSLRVTRQFLQACAPAGTTDEQIGQLNDEIGFADIGAAVNGLIIPARTRG